ncbi:transmembrane protein, putative (macronuclear) [Tetrahymena thermophila SB210]|uniref:Transmembrane protein, putative n=1 Tax=Tetrahymena thermophila (strain SB210) TaxID=312017 RepID=I7MJ20_TETTS|nr:transmembrane protein, putative [Tetrahymena thermophila SB210]EAR95723.2 transmembrane protein, putative [Tetrahymena thermophila SB210]|eukprot:XP_001015968.2 transmembrane protein, putative [Tetrahymena thermophila SB210]
MVFFSIKQKWLIIFNLHISTLICTSPLINFSSQISQITMLTFYSNDYLIVINTDQKLITYQISSNQTSTYSNGKCINAYYYQDMYVYGGGDNNFLYNALFVNLNLSKYNQYSQLQYSDSRLQSLVVLSGQDNVVSIKQNNIIQWMYSNNKLVNLNGCTGQFRGLISFKQSQKFLALCGEILIQWEQTTTSSQINASVVIIQPFIAAGCQYLQIVKLGGPIGDSTIQDFILVEDNLVTLCTYSNGQVTRKQSTQLASRPSQVLISQWRFFYIDSSKTNIFMYEILQNNNLIYRANINGTFTLSAMAISPDNSQLAYADQTSVSVWRYTQGICQTGFMWDKDQQLCVQCSYYCSSCSQSISQCDACQTASNGLSIYRQDKQNNCQCQSGYYDNGSLVCAQCPYYCQTCSKNNQGNVQCTSCSQNSSRDQNNICSCLKGFYDNGTSVCQKCDQTCMTCQKIQQIVQCTQCDPNSFRILNAGKCVCQTGYQEYTVPQSKCLSSACFSTCKTCSQPQDQFSCSSCSPDRTLVQQQNGNICQCNPGFYENNKFVCTPCHSTCKTCNGGQNNNCLTCDSNQNRILDSKTNTCICQDGFFDQSGVCVQCDQTCQTCQGNGPQNCTSCFQKQYRNLSQNQCICNQGFVSVNNNLICQQCADNCQTCNVNQPLKCSVCLPNTNRMLNAQTGNCDCQNGYFQNGSSSICSQCDQSCKTCSNSSKNCLSCSDPLKILQGNTCICQESYFQLEPTNLCQKCTSNCLKCSNSQSCQKCQQNFELSNNNLCVQIIPSTIPQGTLHLVQNSTKTAVYASVGSTVAGSIFLSSFQPNSSIATQLLLLQKFNFMLLINIAYPQLLHEFFIIFGGTSPISSLHKFNIIDKYFIKTEDSPVYISNQFNQENISDSILKNSGGCVVIITIFWIISLPFIIFYKKNEIIRNAEEIKYNSTKLIKNIGENYYPYFLVLIHQVLSLIIFFSVFLQIAAFIKFDPVSDSLFVPKIILLIIVGIYIFFIAGKSLFIVNSIGNYQQDVSLHSTEKIEQSIYSNINLNQKGNTFFRRNYKLIQITIENIFIPIFIIFFGFDSQIQIGLCLGFYVLLFILTVATSPMNKFIDNLFLILDQSCWIILYATILFIAVKLSFILDFNQISEKDIQLFTTLSWVAIGSCIMILLLNPIYLIVQLFSLRKEYQAQIKEICNKIKQKFQKNESQDQESVTNYDNVSLYDFTLKNTSKLWDRSTIHQQHMLEQYRSMRQLQSNPSIFNSPPLLSQVKKIKLNKQIELSKKHEIELPTKSISLQQSTKAQQQEKNHKQKNEKLDLKKINDKLM